MNHIYRSILNEQTGSFVAVSEASNGGGKQASAGGRVAVGGFALKALAASLLMGFGSNLYALPVDGVVVGGNAGIGTGTGTMTITQTSQNAAINWQSFSIGQGEAVTFMQPNSHSVALNRVLGADPSNILGTLSANGKVFLVNPNGILFAQGASVNAAGLVASTLDIKVSDFMAGNYKFAGAGTSTILNQGSINADGGYVALLGASVSNQGTINARLGTVALAAGNAITLDVAGDGLINVTVDPGAVNALVNNGGMLQADGGHVLMSAQAAGDLLHTAVNNTGVIQAHTIENRSGTIRLLGDMQSGTVNVAGKLDASAPNGGNGGFIDTSAAQVKIADDTTVTTAAVHGLTGSWLIDPTDYTIAATGGDITGAQLGTNLGSTNVTILSTSNGSGSNGNVNVNDSVTWSANKLTLNAQNNININANLNASATASLALEYGQGALAAGNTSNVLTTNASVNLPAGTTNFTTRQGSDGVVKNYTVITSLGAAGSTTGTDLQGIAGNLSGNYALGSNIDAAETSAWNAGAGFAPLGSDSTRFTGVFDGLGHTVSDLIINRTGSQYTGLFSYTATGSMVRNVGLIGGSVASDSWGTGSLVGVLGGALINSYATVSVYGFQTVGGLVGAIDGGAIVGSHATGDVVGGPNGEAGGLVGLIWGAQPGTVTDSYATGNVSSAVGNVGGLVGINWGTVTRSYATGTANGTNYIGGLIGNNSIGSIVDSYATGAVSGNNWVGGLAGNNSTSIINSHATGAVSGIDYVGGLAGSSNGTIANNYATSVVTGGDYVGGLIGENSGATTGNHATGTVTGANRVGGLVGSGSGTLDANYATGAVNATGDNIGGLLGRSNGSTVTNNYATGAVTGNNSVGGLVGFNASGMMGGGTITNNYATGAVAGSNYVGGLIGTNYRVVSDSHASGSVTGGDQIGGLVGGFQSGSINNSYATGKVTATTGASGGLVGYASATINNSYASGAVSGIYQVGGILGAMNGGSITNSYSTSTVTGTGNVGGLVGNSTNGTITTTYSTGAVSGTTDVGGLLGSNDGATVTNGYWDLTTSGQVTSAGGTGLTSVEMQTPSKFVGFNFTTTPGATGNNWFRANGTRPILASEYSTTIDNAHQLQLMAMAPAASYTLGSDINAASTGLGNDVWGSDGFSPISTFSGSFDGRNHTISGITINQPDKPFLGLFAYANSASRISNVGLVGGSVNGSSYAGSLVGRNEGVVSNSYTTASVNGGINAYAGGLVGWLMSGGMISNSYAAGMVASLGAGGLVGRNEGTISNSYASGAVTGINGGGLTGLNEAPGVVTNSFWNMATSGKSNSAGGTGLTTTEMMQLASFSSWNDATPNTIANTGGSGAVWRIYEGHTAPLLTSFMTSLAVTANNVTTTYNGTAFAGSTDYTFGTLTPSQSLPSNSVNSGLLSGKANTTVPAINAGSYALDSGLYSGQMGYDIAFTAGTLTINRAALAITTTGVSKVYDGNTTALGTVSVTGALFGSDTLSGGTFTFDNKNAGTGKSVTVSGVTVNDGNSGNNYIVSYENNTNSQIAKADLAVTGATASNRTYDSTTTAAISGATVTALGSDTVSLTNAATGSFGDKNVGTSKAVSMTAGLTGADAGNYHLVQQSGLRADIGKADLIISTGAVSKTYDGTVAAAGTAIVTGGVTFGNDSISGGIFAFTDKNAGVGNKTVTTSGVTVVDGNSGNNYNVSYIDNTTSTINQAVLTAIASASDKTYDGTTNAAVTFAITNGLVDTETVTVTGSGTFNSKDVVRANLVTVNSTSLADGTSGGLASNYSLASGQTAAATIAVKALSISGMTAADKVYDGGTVATLSGGTLNGLIGAETLALTGQTGTFGDKNVGADKAVTVTRTALADGTGLVSNYSIASPTGLSADITRLSTVSWVGGTIGSWFDAANWAGGAVPDLANVANVVIPAGVIVSFESGNTVLPAQAGAVNVDTLGTEASLIMADGSLNVADSLQLASLVQSGGTINSGTIEVGSLSQSDGALISRGSFTVTNAYSQSGVHGIVTVGGNVDITQTSGSALLGNITTAGTLDVNAVKGDITQLAGTRIATAGTSTVAAPNGDVILANSGNSFATALISGARITRFQNAIASAISLGSVDAEGDADDLSPAAGKPTGLDLTVLGAGIRLAPGEQPNETSNDKNNL